MKVMIMGSGAVGSYFGAVLHKSGHDVVFVARGPHLDAIKSGGLRIESVAAGDFTIHPTAVERPYGSWTPELVLFTVKGYDNEEAIELMRPAAGADTTVLTLQNGVGSGDELSEAFGREHVLIGVTYIDALRKGPGTATETSGRCNIVFGREDGANGDRESAIRGALDVPGIDVVLTSEVAKEQWKKMLFITTWSGMTCMTRGYFEEVLAIPDTREAALRVMRETEAVARAQGVDLDDDAVDAMMGFINSMDGKTLSSMYQDLEGGRPLEVNVINGAVSNIGRSLGVPTPVNDLIAACLAVPHNRAIVERAL